MTKECPICNSTLRNFKQKADRDFFDCPRCGPYSLSYEAGQDLAWHIEHGKNSHALLSHALYYMTRREEWVLITNELLQNILSNTELPKPQEQLENLILWLGEAQPNIGASVLVEDYVISAIGAVDEHSLGFLLNQAKDAGLLTGGCAYNVDKSMVFYPQRLTFSGWQFFVELQRGKSTSRFAFMAMQFGDEELDRVYKDHFKIGVATTGFDLKRVDEGQPAGLIDDRLRVEIRQCRFLIADLTHQNRGAYWEAGFAEGLGKPVIYTCRKDVFEDKAKSTHFDTNHHLTVVWELGKLEDAVERLKATIRATLPEEAKLND